MLGRAFVVPFRIEIGASFGGMYVQLDEMKLSTTPGVRERVGGKGSVWMRTYFFSQSMWVFFFHAMLGEDTRSRRKGVLLKYIIGYKALVRATGREITKY